MKTRHKALLIIFSIIIGIPLMLWLAWLLTTPKPISVFIMDKTSYSVERAQNRAINWVLTHYRFVKPNGSIYDPVNDYYGFFPGDAGNYNTNDLRGLNSTDIQRLAINYHMAYFTDSYGVYTDVWPEENPEVSVVENIYGGLHDEDLLFLQHMIDKDRLVIVEFIFMAPPTKKSQRHEAEKLLGMQWQGWTGKFFHTFNPREEKSVPPWTPVLYEKQNGRKWSENGQGTIMVHEDETLVVLEYPRHLNTPHPHIMTDRKYRRKYGVSNRIPYPGWFDISLPKNDNMEVISWFEFDLTSEGRALLRKFDLPERYPAVIKHKGSNNVYYFAADFGYSPLKQRFVRFKGSRFAELFLADLTDPTDKSGFFYAYYLPLMKNIMSEYQEELLNRQTF
ncbi:MAG: hypothetical protein EA393_06930 [Bacteroidetes bacterium]|nr:MAG: hypothetical protein EA393_06930 [Bacteroidota bacterium]